MSRRPHRTSGSPSRSLLEVLESRIHLSASGLDTPALPTGDIGGTHRYRIEAVAQSTDTSAGTFRFNGILHNAAQAYFDLRRHRPVLNTTTTTTITTSTTTDTTTQTSTQTTTQTSTQTTTPTNTQPTPTPAPAPALPPVTIATVQTNAYARLVITGTSSNDSVYVSQSGATLTIVANGQTQQLTGAWGELVIYGADGDDTIAVSSSVALPTSLYGGAGNNALTAAGPAHNVIVSIGGGVDTDIGNGLNTSYWADTSDSLQASSAETAAGRVHRVAGFYQPWTTSSTNPDYVPLTLSGQNLRDPSDIGTTFRLANRTLWGTAPVQEDVNQGGVADCYFLADLSALAHSAPERLREMAVDLGDGTYAVQFVRNGQPQFVRVDGDFASGYYHGFAYAYPGASGNIWAPLMEKAYTLIRTGANTYNSLSWGWVGTAFNDLGVANTNLYNAQTDANTLYNTVSAALIAGKPVTMVTNSSVSNVPVVASHAYSVYAITRDSSGQVLITLYNPWGFDGAGNDGNPNDGLVTLTFAQVQQNLGWGAVAR